MWEDLLKRPKPLLVILLILLLAGILLVYWPLQQAKKVDLATSQLISKVEVDWQNTQKLFSRQEAVFRYPYLHDENGDYRDQLSKIAAELKEARRLWTDGKKARFNQKTKLCQKATLIVKTAQVLLAKVDQKLSKNEQDLTDQQKKYQQAKNDYDQTEKERATAAKRYYNESPALLPKYTTKLNADLQSAASKLDLIAKNFDVISKLLPAEATLGAKADPQAAAVAIEENNRLLNEAATLAKKVVADLDYQIEAKKKAALTINQAFTEAQATEKHLSQVSVTYHFSPDKALAEANMLQSQAADQQAQAAQVIKKVVEDGKIDYAEAYRLATSSLTKSQEANAEINRQLNAYQNSARKLSEFENASNQASATLATANNSFRTLQQYHAQKKWLTLGDNLNESRKSLQEARSQAQQAKENLSPEMQKFVQAENFLTAAFNTLQAVKDKSQEVINLANSLENYRHEWPSAESSADSTINNQRGNINSYGSYDSGAKSDFERAVDLLADARQNAAGHDYAQAVDNARDAENKANGTGERARHAHKKHQEDEEEAARIASSSHSSSGWGSSSDSGSSTSWGGSSGSSSWGGSSDSGSFSSGGGSDSGSYSSGGSSDGGGW